MSSDTRNQLFIPSFRSFEQLRSPNLDITGDFGCVLVKFKDEEIINIISSVLKSFSRENFKVSPDVFDWCLQIVAFSFRLAPNEAKNITFAFHYLFQWMNYFPFETSEENKQIYYQKFLIYLSQLYMNPYFKVIFVEFDERIRKICKNKILSKETHAVLVQVLLCGCKEYINTELAPAMNQLAIESFLYEDTPEWFELFRKRIEELFKSDQFANDFLVVVKKIYTEKLIENVDFENDHFFSFFMSAISNNFSTNSKHKAFGTILSCYHKVYNELDTERIVLQKFPIDFIKRHFLQWYSIEYECSTNQEKHERNFIYDLLVYGGPEIDQEIKSIAENVLLYQISNPELIQDFWDVPQDCYQYLIKNPTFVFDNADHFLTMFENFLSLANTNDKIGVLYGIQSILNSIVHSLDNNNPDQQLIQRLADIVTQIPQLNIGLISLSLVQLYHLDSEYLWTMMESSCQHLIQSTGSAYNSIIVYLYFSFFCLIGNDSFHNQFQIPSSFWNLVKLIYIPDSLQIEERLVLLLIIYTMTESTDYFIQNANEGTAVINSLKKDKTTGIVDFQQIVRLSILCGHTYNKALTKQIPEDEKAEHYITKRLIVSVIGKERIILHHVLGMSEFYISEPEYTKGVPTEYKLDESKLDFEEEDIKEEVSSDPEVEEGCKIFKFERTYPNQKFLKDIEMSSNGHAFLADFGFFSFLTKAAFPIPKEHINLISKIDQLTSMQTFEICVLQINENDCSLCSEETPGIKSMIDDLFHDSPNQIITTPICHFSFIFPYLNNMNGFNDEELLKKYGIAIIFNESKRIVNPLCHKWEKCNFVISITLRDREFYIVELVYDKIGIPVPLSLPFKQKLVAKEKLSKFILLLTYLYFAVPISSEQNSEIQQKRGPDSFLTPIHNRSKAFMELLLLSKMSPAQIIDYMSNL